MKITWKSWLAYIDRLTKVDDKATAMVEEWLENHGFPQTREDINKLIEFAYFVSDKYGEAAASIAAEMYDGVAQASKAKVPPAVPAQTPEIGEVAKAINGTLKTGNTEIVSSSIGRLVKRTGVDTTQQNALRDGAEWAWIPHGDTCAFCLTLASRGWQRASKKAIKNGHAEHIHANCDCTYAIRFDSSTNVEGYDPQKYLDIYENAEGTTPKDKINAMRREFYAKNKAVGDTGEDAEEINVLKIPDFIAAKTIDEAKKFAESFANNVRYGQGVTLDKANEVNETLNTLTAKYPINKLDTIRAMRGNSSAEAESCFDEIGLNWSKLGVKNDNYELGRKLFEYNIKSIEKEYAGRAMPDKVLNQLERYKYRLQFARSHVGGHDVKATIIHEYGHIISDQYWGMINGKIAKQGYGIADKAIEEKLVKVFNKAKSNGDIFKISSYADESAHEFFAECFAAREMGEKLPDYIEKIVGEIVNGSAM